MDRMERFFKIDQLLRHAQMNEGEIYALLTMQQLLSGMQPGLLGDHIQPIMERVNKLPDSANHSVLSHHNA
ncbi:MAG: hypothetical protein GXP22_09975 [Gammaproteobacteria bacterium]|nr:hypothetical protein [Gammaproteobacteria bacterium]